MSVKQAQKIEVGMHDGRPGFTIEYTDGERGHFIFGKHIAKALADGLLQLIKDLDYVDRQLTGAPSDRIGISEHVSVKVTPPAFGINGGDGIGVSD